MDHTVQAGTPRRELFKGAAGIAAGAAAATMLTGGSPVAAAGKTTMSMSLGGLGAFEVLAFSWGASQSGSTHVGGGGGAGKANFQDISVTKFTDTITPELLKALATGQHLAEATLTVTQQSGPTVTYRLEDILVTSLSTGGAGGEALTENASFNFREFVFQVDQLSFGWDIAANTGA